MQQIEIMAIKINYDSREDLPSYLKYSRLPTKREYKKFVDLYNKKGIGGDGFHEGLNFHPENNEIKFYLPPTCIPSKDKMNREFIVFSFSYKGDKENPSTIIGVHAGAKILGADGIDRGESVGLSGVGDYTYHGVSPRMLTTIFTTPIIYNSKDGRYLPYLGKWGYGRRYLDKIHAVNILQTAYVNATKKLESEKYINLAEKEVVLHEVLVIKNILSKYFGINMDDNKLNENISSDYFMDDNYQEADNEIGYKGEHYVFEKEIEYMENNKLPISLVEWLSQMNPTAVFDIKTVRIVNGKLQEHFLEVKSSKLGYGESAYLSERQNKFFKEHKKNSHIVFVNFNGDEPEVSYKTYDELNEEFHLSPIKYKLLLK
ncbi:protein NO VEIN domain-containing protein [Providencia rettgeri]|uniref:protein NO VEIN domain-containing protein n=1 Tax=Providencia rettgeri TaxID=587 RepID=UPI001BA9EC8A|nr:DUF3883 domain-containing protein [Providencia rettgeri]MBS0858610.1 DUF3883 domain-containing protein [Providencia rettgeri]MBS0872348.1 DUF3883 domain-containing protein [Providencia rettgeri]MBS0919494.1 DUF3883 domain-containing protein [Providencia rettgeri]